jgi:hypothetical protein
MDIVIQGMGRIRMLDFHDDRANLRATVELLRHSIRLVRTSPRQAETMKQRFLDRSISSASTPLKCGRACDCSPARLIWFFILARLPLDPIPQSCADASGGRADHTDYQHP